MTRIGPQMARVVDYVRAHPGVTKHEVSLWVGPHGSNAYGWRTVQRALKAGLIENRSTNFHRSALHVTETTTREG